MSNRENDTWVEARLLWLSEYGCDEKDVMDDSKGEYIYTEVDDGETVELKKIYLPDNMQTEYGED